MVGEGGGGGGGGGSKYYGIINDPPPTAEYKMLLASPVCTLSGLFISFYFHAFNTKTLWLVKGGGGGVVGGGQNIMAIIK